MAGHMTFEEVCSCGASLKLPMATFHSSIVEEWRAGHRHEFPPVGDMVVESGSSHERAPDEADAQNRVTLGFQRA